MTLNRRTLFVLLTGFSVAMILGAWVFQYVFGYAPCKLCFYQRYPHWAAAGFGLLAIGLGGTLLPYLAALSVATTGAIGVFHSGVERKLWQGPSTCTSSSIQGLSTDDLFDQIMAAPLVRCDDIPWEMFGLTMANLNALFSLSAAVLWVVAARMVRR